MLKGLGAEVCSAPMNAYTIEQMLHEREKIKKNKKRKAVKDRDVISIVSTKKRS